MAATTIGAKFTVVHVVRPVAVSTTAANFPHLVECAAVTCLASNIDVRAVEGELGLVVMVEYPEVPTDRVMTGLAAVLKSPVMWVILGVTCDAVSLCTREFLRLVALIALLVGMMAMQRELGQVVIKKQWVLPIDLGVTAFAL